MFPASRVIAACAIATLSACSALNSYDHPMEGVPYFLPKTQIRYSIDYTDVSLSQITTRSASGSQPYYLSYQANAFADENVCIDRTSTGLLKKVYFGAQDRTADILIDVLELVARGLSNDESEHGAGPRAACTGTAESKWMDPYDRAALNEFNSTLCHGMHVEVPDAVDQMAAPTVCPVDAICFTTKSTMDAYLTGPQGKVLKSFQSQTVSSARDLGWIKVRDACFNKRITQLDFDEGTLTTMRVRKDSEILGLVQFPLNAVERLLAVPGNAIGMAFSGYQERLLYLQRRKALADAGATAPAQPAAPDTSINTEVMACASAAVKQ